jgi:hypothetical protein
MIYTALRQLSGVYGSAAPGDQIEIADEAIAQELEARGLVVKGKKQFSDELFAKGAARAAGQTAAEESDEDAPPSGATQLDPAAVKEAEKAAKKTGPKENK